MLDRYFLAAFLFSCGSTGLQAQERTDYMALQHALSQTGHYSGTVDGLTGPATRAAISSYAADNNIRDDFWDVSSTLSRNIVWEIEWNDAFEKGLNSVLEDYLLDAQSARIDEKRVFRNNKGKLTACAKVNAKNSYGAYTGYQWLFMPVVYTEYDGGLLKLDDVAFFVSPRSDMPQHVAEMWCRLGYVMG